MLFDVQILRDRGRLAQRWSRREVRGHLYVREAWDAELKRSVRQASICDDLGRPLVPELHDAVLVDARPHSWTMTGYEVVAEAPAGTSTHYRQSWALIPAVEADAERAA